MLPPFAKKLLEMRGFLVINLVVLFFLSLSFGRTFLRNAVIQNEIDALEAEKTELAGKNSGLLDLAQQLQTKFYVEKEGRKKYGLQKTGERLVIVTDPAKQEMKNVGGELLADSTDSSDQAVNSVEVIPNPRRWWWFFFNQQAFEQLSYGE